MNERIRLLAEQAGIHDDVCRGCPIHELDKFALLIVEECATVIERNLFQGIGWNTSRAVRRHFGIEDEE